MKAGFEEGTYHILNPHTNHTFLLRIPGNLETCLKFQKKAKADSLQSLTRRGLRLGEKPCKEDWTFPSLEPGAAQGSEGHLSCQGWAAWVGEFYSTYVAALTWGA